MLMPITSLQSFPSLDGRHLQYIVVMRFILWRTYKNILCSMCVHRHGLFNRRRTTISVQSEPPPSQIIFKAFTGLSIVYNVFFSSCVCILSIDINVSLSKELNAAEWANANPEQKIAAIRLVSLRAQIQWTAWRWSSRLFWPVSPFQRADRSMQTAHWSKPSAAPKWRVHSVALRTARWFSVIE